MSIHIREQTQKSTHEWIFTSCHGLSWINQVLCFIACRLCNVASRMCKRRCCHCMCLCLELSLCVALVLFGCQGL